MQLFSSGRAEIIGAPKSFNLLHELTTASSVRLAVAFAHDSGWRMLKPSLDKSNAKLFLLAGGSFFHTEPRVLRAWMKQPETEAKLYLAKKFVFHPKVLIVDGPLPFAIVGSGNLSRGGLDKNIECGVYIDAPDQLTELLDWFKQVYDEANAVASVIHGYEQKWKLLRDGARDLAKKQQELEIQLVKTVEATMARWDDAVRLAKKVQKDAEFKSLYDGRVAGGQKIKKFLHFPNFDFNHTEWKQFYAVSELGRLDNRSRDSIFEERVRLQKGLQQLISSGGREDVLEELLSEKGKWRIKGLGVNTISKVLAVHMPEDFSVYNNPVEKALRNFGYVPPRGASKAGKYLAYNSKMKEFKEIAKLRDAYALDVFFYHHAQEL